MVRRKNRVLSKLFELRKFEFFQISSNTNTVCKKAEMFQLSIWAMKLWNISNYINYRIAQQKIVIFWASFWSFETLKYNKLFHRRHLFLELLNFSSKLVKLWMNLKFFKLPHTRNRFAKKKKFLSKLFELWKFEIFQVFSKTKTVCKKAEIFQQSIWATKFWNISSYINDRIGQQKSVIFYASFWSFETLK